jgi:predicted nucleic acid-binding protein
LYDVAQPFHRLARTVYRTARQQNRTFVTTNYVIAELVALLTSPFRVPRPDLVRFISALKSAPHIEVFHVDPVVDGHGWQLLQNRQDKLWSMVDCVSFVVMQRRGILEALTTDHHFEQAGFVRLLK